MLVRGSDLSASMSRYLVDRIEGLTNIEVLRRAQVSGLEGRDGSWKRCAGVSAPTEKRCGGQFATCFYSSAREPNTNWLAGSDVALDAKGLC